MLRFKPKDRKARARPRRRCAYLGTDERAGRDYFLSGPHDFHIRCGMPPAPAPFAAGGCREVSSSCAPLVAFNRQQKALRHKEEF